MLPRRLALLRVGLIVRSLSPSRRLGFGGALKQKCSVAVIPFMVAHLSVGNVGHFPRLGIRTIGIQVIFPDYLSPWIATRAYGHAKYTAFCRGSLEKLRVD